MRLRKREIEWAVPLLTLLLVAAGLVAVASASSAAGGAYFLRQLMYLAIGLPLFAAAAFLPDRVTLAFSYAFYMAVLLLLGLVLMVGTGPTGRWLGVGMVHIQPSEVAKLASLLACARFLADKRNDLSKAKNLLYLAVIAGAPFILVLIEPDLGTSLVFPVVAMTLAIWAGIPMLVLAVLASPVLVMIASTNPYALVIVIGLLIVFAYASGVRLPLGLIWGGVTGAIGAATPWLIMHLKPYQRQRLTAFLHPEADPLGAGYQLIQSKVAIGSGLFWGKGFQHGSQTQGGFLPEPHTDFIFSVIGEEFGFVGATLLLLLFFLLVVRLLMLARKVHNPFSSLVLTGLAAWLAFQVVVNVGMTVGIMPVTGLPLPLVSYGGSSLLTFLIALGLATGMGSRWRGAG